METEQMTARLLTKMKAEIRTSQAKADGNLKEMMEEMTASQELLKEEMLAKLNAHHKKNDGQDGLPARENGGCRGCLR
jgi:hypothetical protein